LALMIAPLLLFGGLALLALVSSAGASSRPRRPGDEDDARLIEDAAFSHDLALIAQAIAAAERLGMASAVALLNERMRLLQGLPAHGAECDPTAAKIILKAANTSEDPYELLEAAAYLDRCGFRAAARKICARAETPLAADRERALLKQYLEAERRTTRGLSEAELLERARLRVSIVRDQRAQLAEHKSCSASVTLQHPDGTTSIVYEAPPPMIVPSKPPTPSVPTVVTSPTGPVVVYVTPPLRPEDRPIPSAPPTPPSTVVAPDGTPVMITPPTPEDAAARKAADDRLKASTAMAMAKLKADASLDAATKRAAMDRLQAETEAAQQRLSAVARLDKTKTDLELKKLKAESDAALQVIADAEKKQRRSTDDAEKQRKREEADAERKRNEAEQTRVDMNRRVQAQQQAEIDAKAKAAKDVKDAAALAALNDQQRQVEAERKRVAAAEAAAKREVAETDRILKARRIVSDKVLAIVKKAKGESDPMTLKSYAEQIRKICAAPADVTSGVVECATYEDTAVALEERADRAARAAYDKIESDRKAAATKAEADQKAAVEKQRQSAQADADAAQRAKDAEARKIRKKALESTDADDVMWAVADLEKRGYKALSDEVAAHADKLATQRTATQRDADAQRQMDEAQKKKASIEKAAVEKQKKQTAAAPAPRAAADEVMVFTEEEADPATHAKAIMQRAKFEKDPNVLLRYAIEVRSLGPNYEGNAKALEQVAAQRFKTTATAPQSPSTSGASAAATASSRESRAVTPPDPSPFSHLGVDDDAWNEYVVLMQRAPLNTVTPKYELGQYGFTMRRLSDLGYATNPRNVQYQGRTVTMADWVPPYSLEMFLASSDLQRQAFRQDMEQLGHHIIENYGESTLGRVGPDGRIITLSGLLAVGKMAHVVGLAKWLQSPSDRARFPATTEWYSRAVGIF
jgi:hypothetical protein